ncbi:hypothetical protein DL771_005757 [Monosporascus sp. 5C6A]|nr:hypothetical protein DL771_005757 [Monosporascus sp. 5C6A]
MWTRSRRLPALSSCGIARSAGTFDDCAPYGGEEWNWENCRRYLYEPATYHDDRHDRSEELAYIGAGGPISVSHPDLVPEIAGFRNALTQAWTSKGGGLTEDVHNGTMRCLWKCTTSIYNGKRSSSWMYLEGKKNATVLSKTNSKRLLIDEVTKKCIGVEVLLPTKLLMLSGIGREVDLAKFNIKPIVDSAQVGQNLLDHPILAHVFRLEYGNGLDHHLLRAGLEHDAAVSAYRWKNKGPYASGLLELVGLPRIDDRFMQYPEYIAAKEANGGLHPFGPAGQPHSEIDFVPMHPLGRRRPDDWRRDEAKIKEDYPWPMPRTSDAAMDKMILERSQKGFHPCGSARMGRNIEQGVDDGNLRVFGVEKLRVIDASIIPVTPDCQIQNSVYMIAEKVPHPIVNRMVQ